MDHTFKGIRHYIDVLKEYSTAPAPAAADTKAQYDNEKQILTHAGKQYTWNPQAQVSGQGTVVSAPSMAVGSRSMGLTNVELNADGTFTKTDRTPTAPAAAPATPAPAPATPAPAPTGSGSPMPGIKPTAPAPAASKAINIDVRGTQSAAMSKIDPANYPDERAYAQAVAAAGNTAGADALAKQGQAAGLTTAAAIPVPAPKVAAPAPAPAKAPYKGSIGAQEIQKLNPAIIDVNRIQVGQTLKMPNGQPDYVVKPGDTLDRIAKGVKPAQGAMSANVAPAGQPAATAANPALGTIQGATKAIPAVAPPAGNPGGVGKNATYTTDEIAAAREALKDPKLGASDRAFYTGMLANQPKAVKENTGYDEVQRIVSLVHYR